MNKQHQMIGELEDHLTNVFRDEEDRTNIQISSKNITEDYFYALLQAFRLHFMRLTSSKDMDLLDFIALLNRLSFQFLQASDDEVDEYGNEVNE